MQIESCRLFFMPGVPRELVGMFEDSVLPEILEAFRIEPPPVASFKLFGKGESDVAQALDGLDAELPSGASLTIQYRASFPEIHVRLVLQGMSEKKGAACLHRLGREMNERLGRHIFASGGVRLDTTFPEVVIADARRAGATISTAESASAGDVARLLTAVSDSDDVYPGGVVAGTVAARRELLASSCEAAADTDASGLAEGMARAIRARLHTTHGVATVGCAIDRTDEATSTPGTLWVGLASPHGTTCREIHFPIEAERFRILAAHAALQMFRRSLS
jgi:nicotinamide-nucleotide amidase